MSQPTGSTKKRHIVFAPERLRVYVVTPDDVDLFYALWTDPRVMRNVGFPRGLPITREQIVDQLQGQAGRVFDTLLGVRLSDSGDLIGVQAGVAKR